MKEKFGSYSDLVGTMICKVRGGDQKAFSELLQLYEPLFTSLLSKCDQEHANEQDLEDIKQELTVVFYNAILSFDLEQKDVNFGLYAKICLQNALITQLRNLRKRTNLIAGDEELLDSAVGDDEFFASFTKKEELLELTHKIEGELSPLENRVWRLYVTGMSCKDVAEAVGKSEKSVENAIFRIRQKLKNLFPK